MKYYTKTEYERRLKKAQRDSEQKEFRRNIRETKNQWRDAKPKMETSKKIAIYLFILLNVVVVYCLVTMWHFADLTYLGVLITDIAAQIMIYGIYCLKAYKAKKSEENIKFEREKWLGLGDILEAGAESEEPVPIEGAETFENGSESEVENETDLFSFNASGCANIE